MSLKSKKKKEEKKTKRQHTRAKAGEGRGVAEDGPEVETIESPEEGEEEEPPPEVLARVNHGLLLREAELPVYGRPSRAALNPHAPSLTLAAAASPSVSAVAAAGAGGQAPGLFIRLRPSLHLPSISDRGDAYQRYFIWRTFFWPLPNIRKLTCVKFT